MFSRNYRAYFLTNMYLSSIQNGIQTAHCTAEFYVKYGINTPKGKIVYDWASQDKTMIVLNGGYCSALRDFAEFLNNDLNPFPWATFNESQEALDGALTATGIILPEDTYSLIRNGPEGAAPFSLDDLILVEKVLPWEAELIVRLRTFGLAK